MGRGDYSMEYLDIDVTKKANFKYGMLVDINNNGNIIRGWIDKILSSGNVSDGIKVQLTNGATGRVIGIPNPSDLEKKNFKFYNLLMNNQELWLIFYRKENKLFTLNNKFLYLFSDKKIAEASIKNTIFEDNQYMLRPFPSATKLFNYLKKNDVVFEMVIIDKERQLTKIQFEDLYKKFYNC